MMLITKSTFNNQQYGETTLKNGETKMKKRTLVEESENTVLEINNLKKKYFKYETQYDEANDIIKYCIGQGQCWNCEYYNTGGVK